MQQLLQTLNKKDEVSILQVPVEHFFQQGAFLSKIYEEFKLVTVQKNHMFWVDEVESTMNTRIFLDSVEKNKQDLKKGKKKGEDWVVAMKAFQRECLKPPGMWDIKRVDIYTKW